MNQIPTQADTKYLGEFKCSISYANNDGVLNYATRSVDDSCTCYKRNIPHNCKSVSFLNSGNLPNFMRSCLDTYYINYCYFCSSTHHPSTTLPHPKTQKRKNGKEGCHSIQIGTLQSVNDNRSYTPFGWLICCGSGQCSCGSLLFVIMSFSLLTFCTIKAVVRLSFCERSPLLLLQSFTVIHDVSLFCKMNHC